TGKFLGIPFVSREVFDAVQKPTDRVRMFLSGYQRYFDAHAADRARFFDGSGIPSVHVAGAFDSYVRAQGGTSERERRPGGIEVAYCDPKTKLTYTEMLHCAWMAQFRAPAVLKIVPRVSHMLHVQLPTETARAIHEGILETGGV